MINWHSTQWDPKDYRPENPNFKLIAHRGNVTGPCEYENNPEYVKEALNDGFDVEVDVWFNGCVDRKYYEGLYLGHDKPQYKIDFSFLENPRIWAHAKNCDALNVMINHEKSIHAFWHQNDDYTLTSQGYIWTYPEKQILKKSIIVRLDEISKYDLPIYKKTCSGICSDYLK